MHGEATIIDEKDVVVFECYNRDMHRVVQRGHCLESLIQHSTLIVPTVMERRTCFEKAGGFDERLRSAEDYLHWLQIALEGYAFGYVEEPVARYRWRSGSLSGSTTGMAEGLIEMCRILLDTDWPAWSEYPELRNALRIRQYDLECNLPFLYRKEGNTALARRRSLDLISKAPAWPRAYLELMKSLAPKVILDAWHSRWFAYSRSRLSRAGTSRR